MLASCWVARKMRRSPSTPVSIQVAVAGSVIAPAREYSMSKRLWEAHLQARRTCRNGSLAIHTLVSLGGASPGEKLAPPKPGPANRGSGFEIPLPPLVVEGLLVLLQDGIAWLGQDLDQRRLIQLVQDADH